MKFIDMDDGCEEVEVHPSTIVRGADGRLIPAVKAPHGLPVFVVGGNDDGNRLILAEKPAPIEERTLEASSTQPFKMALGHPWEKLPNGVRTKALLIVNSLRSAEFCAFGCYAPLHKVVISDEGCRVRVRVGPGITRGAEIVSGLESLDFSDLGACGTAILRRWDMPSDGYGPKGKYSKAGELALETAHHEWWCCDFDMMPTADPQKVMRAIELELMTRWKTVRMDPIERPEPLARGLAAPATHQASTVVRAYRPPAPVEKGGFSVGYKPQWIDRMAEVICGELCMVEGSRAWTQAVCESSVRSAPSYTRHSGRWKPVTETVDPVPTPPDLGKQIRSMDDQRKIDKAANPRTIANYVTSKPSTWF